MRFTIAIPTHNDSDVIKKCIISACNVDFEDYEILISDTSSDEKTKSIVDSLDCYKTKIRYFKNNHLWSMWENHNFCLREGKGDYILFIHSDDYLFDDSLQIFNNHIEKLGNPKRIVMCGRSLYKDWGSLVRNHGVQFESIVSGTDAISLFLESGLTPSGTLISRYEFCSLGGYLDDCWQVPFSDCISMIHAAFKGFKFYFVNDLLFYRSGNGQPFPKCTVSKSLEFYNKLILYFTQNEILTLVKTSIVIDCYALTRFFVWNKQYKTIIAKHIRHLFFKNTRFYFSRNIRKIRYFLRHKCDKRRNKHESSNSSWW